MRPVQSLVRVRVQPGARPPDVLTRSWRPRSRGWLGGTCWLLLGGIPKIACDMGRQIGRWMTVTITWEDDCRWMTVRGLSGVGSVTWGVFTVQLWKIVVDGSAGGQVFGQWSRASGLWRQETFQDNSHSTDTEQEVVSVTIVLDRTSPPPEAGEHQGRAGVRVEAEEQSRGQEVQKSESKTRSPTPKPPYGKVR